MSPRFVCAAILVLGMGGTDWGQAHADGPSDPPALTDQQKQRLAERDLLFVEARKASLAGRQSAAIAGLEKVVAIEREVFGNAHEKVAESVEILARLHEGRDDYASARKAREEVVAIREKLHGKDHWRVTNARIARQKAGLLEEMDAVGQQEVRQAAAANARALQLYTQGKDREAIALAEPAGDIFKKRLGETHPDYATSLNNLAQLYRSTGDHGRALPLFEQSRDIRKKTLGEMHPDYAHSLHSLAVLYQSTRNNGKAQMLHEQARDIRKKTLGETHPDYAHSLQSLAELYHSAGDSGKAIPLAEQAHDITRKVLGETHPGYHASLNTLAELYRSAGDHGKALPLFEQARDILKKELGETHPNYATSLNNLAELYKSTEDYGKALPLYEQARDILKKELGETDPRYATSLNNLAQLYLSTGDYGKALPLFEQARDILKKELGETHPHYAASLNSLAQLYHETGDPVTAARFAHQGLLARAVATDTSFNGLNARLRLHLLDNLRYCLDRYLSVALPSNAEAGELHGHVLAWKGAVASRQAEERIARQQPQLTPLLDKLRQARAALSQISSSPPRDPKLRPDWIASIRQFEAEKEKLEAELAIESAAFRRLRKATSADVSAALSADAAFVDLLEFTHATPSKEQKGRYDLQQRYLAIVLRKGRNPILVELNEAQPIDDAVAAWRTKGRLSATPDASVRTLDERVWQPIRKHLGDAKSVYLSADGALAKFPFAALPGSRPGTYLLEELTLTHVTSGRHLLELADARDDPKSTGLLTVGALTFGKPTDGEPDWQELPGTDQEARATTAAFAKHHPSVRKPQLLTGNEVDVTRLRRELRPADGSRPQFLHLATHGFFTEPKAPAPKRKTPDGPLTDEELKRLYTYDRNPLLSSGLVLSGANADPGKGVLTAEEVLGMDLRGVELAVLSACETGLGKVSGSQGVQGLQQAFHTAGVRTLVASLWHVEDAATSVLMEEFYANLWGKKLSRAEALRQAQLTVMKNPNKVLARRTELREELAKRGISEEVLVSRGLGKAGALPDGGKAEPGKERRSPPSQWAAFLLSGSPGKID